jgi:hypothetical protein
LARECYIPAVGQLVPGIHRGMPVKKPRSARKTARVQ